MILVVSNMYPSKKYPNYGVFVKNFYEQLSLSEKTDIIYLHKTTSKVQKLIKYLEFYGKTFRQYAFGKYEVVYVHYAGYNAPPILLAKMFNKSTKLIVNVHGSDVTPEKKLEEKTNFLTKYLVRKADLTVVPSSYFEEVVIEKYGENSPIWISPSAGIDFSLFNHQNKKVENEVFTIGYVSRIDKEKGWDTLLYAFKNLTQHNKNIRLIMVGDGAQNDEALALIKELGLETYVEKHNCLTQKELVGIYSSLDVFIFPSTRAGESLGLVGLEAMACGTPVIGSNLGGIKTYVKDGKNGFLIAPGNQKELETAIENYRNLTVEEKKEFSQYAVETAKKYDSTKVSQQLIEKIREVSEKR
ncbi:glycosyltransferase [Enterococcus sp. ZJ1622]|uniref:glycosyltransferase n=1 Tax=Enterococcus sp. ZJ1622 TaxID=2709401 RepID=UPI0013EBB4B8|nr:glycosyltransferase [Enterococcus sp. ZJ1622]